jgi:hypothetical protein
MDLTGFSGRKRALGQKLANAGVWPRRIPELLGRYTADRIEANFQLYRKRAQQVRESGAWLAAAIEGGYALPSPPDGSSPESSSEPSGPASPEENPRQAKRLNRADGQGAPALPEPGTKVTETRKRALIEAGLAAEADFDRFRHGGPEEKQHFYRIEKTPSRARSSPAARP